MPFFDYIVADEFIIPADAEAGYSEKVLRLPGSYQPNDPHRTRARDTTRAHWGLPEDAVVMANFSQPFKLTPAMFDLWCELLRRDGRRLLWLLGESTTEQDWLRGQAQDRGLAPERICFGSKLPSQAHLDRLRHADLVLDTFPYGGHTLTSDALWAGTPVVTLCGETFASRVAASLLHDLGMGELVAYTEQSYLDQAESLLSNPQQRQFWRRHLDAGRDSFALFNAQAYARKFEAMVRSVLS
jgi:predicted O-linked N-acetylglucosamine transferase (SPINDLY family)